MTGKCIWGINGNSIKVLYWQSDKNCLMSIQIFIPLNHSTPSIFTISTKYSTHHYFETNGT